MSASNPAVLLVLDLQQGLVEPPPEDGPRSTPSLTTNASAILARWRQLQYPLIHIHHDATNPLDPLHPSHPESNAAHSCVAPLPGEVIRHKTTSSAFASDHDGVSLLDSLKALEAPSTSSGSGSGSDEREQEQEQEQEQKQKRKRKLVIMGMDGAQCVNSTTRSANDLGFEVTVVADASASSGTPDWRGEAGRATSAEETHGMAMSMLAVAYAKVVTTEELLQGLGKVI